MSEDNYNLHPNIRVLLNHQKTLSEICDEPNIIKRGELVSSLLKIIRIEYPEVYPFVVEGLRDMVME